MSLGIFLSYCLVAVFAVNPLFAAITGIDSFLDAMKKPKRLLVLCVAVSAFSLLSSMVMYPIDMKLKSEDPAMIVRGLFFSGIMLALYFVSIKIVNAVSSEFYDEYGNLLAPAALNGTAVGVALIVAYDRFLGLESVQFLVFDDFSSFAIAVAIGIGTGIAFSISALLVKEGLRIANNPDLSPNMKGAPILLIYIGILSMAFSFVFGNITLFGSGA